MNIELNWLQNKKDQTNNTCKWIQLAVVEIILENEYSSPWLQFMFYSREKTNENWPVIDSVGTLHADSARNQFLDLFGILKCTWRMRDNQDSMQLHQNF